MKETGNIIVWLPLALWLVVTLCALPTLAAEQEMVIAEGLSAARTAQPEWIALGFSSAWALLLQIFRLKK